jgi:hypothetical protein
MRAPTYRSIHVALFVGCRPCRRTSSHRRSDMHVPNDKHARPAFERDEVIRHPIRHHPLSNQRTQINWVRIARRSGLVRSIGSDGARRCVVRCGRVRTCHLPGEQALFGQSAAKSVQNLSGRGRRQNTGGHQARRDAFDVCQAKTLRPVRLGRSITDALLDQVFKVCLAVHRSSIPLRPWLSPGDSSNRAYYGSRHSGCDLQERVTWGPCRMRAAAC